MSDRKHLISLDILRGLACLLVWLNHIRVTTRYFQDAKYDFIQLFTAWGHEAVAVFFILSGVVINLSTKRNIGRSRFLKKRLVRIYPIYLVVIFLCFSVNYFIFGNDLSIKTLVGNVFLVSALSGYPIPTTPLNPAVWSISCEAFFYIIFISILTTDRLKYIWVWFTISVLSIVTTGLFRMDFGPAFVICYYLNNSFLWLVGYLIFEYRNRLVSSLPVAIGGALMVPMLTRLHLLPPNIGGSGYYVMGIYLLPLFAHLLANYKTVADPSSGSLFKIKHIYLLALYPANAWLLWQYSDSAPANKILYTALPLASFLFYFKPAVVCFKWSINKLQQPFLALADISYPVYLVHMPVMFTIFHLLPEQKLLGMSLAIAMIIGLSSMLEMWLFKKLRSVVN